MAAAGIGGIGGSGRVHLGEVGRREAPLLRLPAELQGLIANCLSDGGLSCFLRASKRLRAEVPPKVTTLDLRSQKITDADLARIVARFPDLQSLDLSFCVELTDAGLAHLAELTQLQSQSCLLLHHNPPFNCPFDKSFTPPLLASFFYPSRASICT